MFLGTYDIDEYVAIPAVTHRFSTGAAYAPSAITYSIYEEGNTTGLDEDVDMTPASPFDTVVGFYYARRQLTAAAGFERNKTYVVLVKATVDSVSAIEAHVFQVRQVPNFSGTGTSANVKVDVETIKTQAVTCGAGVTVLASVGTAATSTAQTGDSYALANGVSGFVAIKGDTAAILADTGTDGVLVATAAKTGYALADATSDAVIADAVWNAATATYGGVGSYGEKVEGLNTSSVTVTTNNDKTGYTVSTVSDKTGYSLTQAFPANFSSLAITAGGAVTAGTVSDKTGYSLSQAFPTNFSALAITAGGAVTAGTVSDKTGYSVALGGIASGSVAAAELNNIADATLDRNMGTGLDSGNNLTIRTVRQALRTSRNKVAIAGGVATIYKEDDVTTSHTFNAATAASDPLSSLTPA